MMINPIIFTRTRTPQQAVAAAAAGACSLIQAFPDRRHRQAAVHGIVLALCQRGGTWQHTGVRPPRQGLRAPP
jgi:hypothetical protein